MRIPKAVLGGFLVLALVAAGVYFLILKKGPADLAGQAETASATTSGERSPSRTPAPPIVSRTAPACPGSGSSMMTRDG